MHPRILLVEDDPTTRAFFAAAIAALPARVDAADCVAVAIDIAAVQGHDLWLIDANLPDGDGAGLLAALRRRGLSTPALAHTADLEPVSHAALRAAGFVAVLVKPLSALQLQAALRDVLGNDIPGNPYRVAEQAGTAHAFAEHAVARDAATAPVWDDHAALVALNGQRAHVDALRQLFLDELPAARDAAMAAVRREDDEALRAVLHKLRASCGFVGAARLGDAVATLHRAPRDAAAMTQFRNAVQDTLSSP
jgi:CheY-like chemotaxis protein/HPt (histidine-containing phosphotransfer) domain-containing protein